MTRFWEIVSTTLLTAIFVPSLLLLPWCDSSVGARHAFLEIFNAVPSWAVKAFIGSIGRCSFALVCIAFAWIIKWTWTTSKARTGRARGELSLQTLFITRLQKLIASPAEQLRSFLTRRQVHSLSCTQQSFRWIA